jgi:peptidyl-prolyl cis-trans isomerase C
LRAGANSPRPKIKESQMPRFILSLALASLAAFAAHAQAPADPVIAKVDGQPVLKSELQATMRGLPAQAQGMPLETLYPMLLERVIDLKLLGTAAKNAKLEDDPAVKKRIADAADRVLQETYLTRAVESKVTEAALRERYKAATADAKGEEEVNARHILLKTEPEAQAVIAELKKGADFADLAKKRSIDPSAASGGGDLGYFTKEQMVPEFSEAAFKLKKGETTETPVKTTFGWHVIKVEDRRTSGPAPFEEMREELTEAMSREVIQDMLKDLRGKAKVERFNLDGSPKTP